jgi:hypothetical protein
MEVIFDYCSEKNIKLKQERGISFEEIIYYINDGHLLEIIEHHNKEKYTSQCFYVIDVEGYVYLVPFVKDGDRVFLKTIFPSRKHTKKYLVQIANRESKNHE